MIEKLVKVVLDLQPKDSGALQRQMEQIRSLRAASLPGNIQQQLHLNSLQGAAQRQFASAAIGGRVASVAGAGAGDMAAQLAGFAMKAGPYVAAAAAVVGATVGAAVALNSLAKAASPFLAQQQEQAWNDVFAVIGRVGLPVLEAFNRGIRLMGDVLQTIIPSQAEFYEITRALQPVWDAMRDLFAEIAPLLREMASEALTKFADVLRLCALAVAGMIRSLADMLKWIRENIPGASKILGNGTLSSSFGASGFSASFGSAEEFAKSQAIAAMSARGSLPDDPAKQTASNTKLMADSLVAFIQIVTGQPAQAIATMARFGRA